MNKPRDQLRSQCMRFQRAYVAAHQDPSFRSLSRSVVPISHTFHSLNVASSTIVGLMPPFFVMEPSCSDDAERSKPQDIHPQTIPYGLIQVKTSRSRIWRAGNFMRKKKVFAERENDMTVHEKERF